MAKYYSIVADRGALADQFTSVGASFTRNTTSPINGTSDLKMAYPSGSTTWNTNATFPYKDGISPRKISITFLMKFSATPTADAVIMSISPVLFFYVSTNRKLKLGTTESTDSAMTAGNTYRVELISDRDWRGVGLGSVLCRYRVDGAGEPAVTTQLDIGGGDTATINILLGQQNGKAATGPNVNIQIKDLVVWASDDSSIKAPWLNNQTPQSVLLPTSNGSYNDFTGNGDATNKYANVDEDPASSSDYNNGGDIAQTRTQGYLPTAPAYGGTIRGVSTTRLMKNVDGTSGTYYVGLRFNSTDYTKNLTGFTSTTLTLPAIFGSPGNPADYSTLSNTDIGNLEFFDQIVTGTPSVGTGSDGPIYKPNATSGTNNTYTLTGGGTKDAAMRDGSDSTYITGANVGDLQGFTVSQNPAFVPPNFGDNITGVSYKVRRRNHALDTTVSSYQAYCIINGTTYFSDISQSCGQASFVDGSSTRFGFTNPATSDRWQIADIIGTAAAGRAVTEWGLKILGKGTSGVDFAELQLLIKTVGGYIITAAWMQVTTGDAFTDNGFLPSGKSRLRRMRGFGR